MKFILTQQGIKLHARVEAGMQLVISKAAASESLSDTPEQLTELNPVNQQLQLNSVTADEDQAVITISLSNISVMQTYTLHTIGIYAIDETGSEILFLVGQDETGEEIRAGSVEEIILEYNVALKVSNSEQVIFVQNINDYVLKKDLNNLQEQVNDIVDLLNKLVSEDHITTSFLSVFTMTGLEESGESSVEAVAMTAEEIEEAINTPWNGESSENPNALSAEEIAEAISTPWNGESSNNPNALSAEEIAEAIAGATTG